MDLPAILARAPELCLVDELAHSNAAGVEHAKRHEDVGDLLEAGIDVLTTVNVQHLESLNDQVAELTGVRVRETFPDRLLAEADEVVLVDVTPEALIARLREGRVYPRARVATALQNFFRIENLQALREVALRQVAEEVEARRLVGEPLAERLLALAKPGPGSERVVRRAWRSAQRLHAQLDVLVVRPPGEEASTRAREELEALRRLAAMLGARLLVEEGDDVATVAARVVRERGTTYVLLGAPSARRGLGRLGESLPDRLLRLAPGVDVRIVADRGR
jgi:two-component system sensor histidine kinase KdpD